MARWDVLIIIIQNLLYNQLAIYELVLYLYILLLLLLLLVWVLFSLIIVKFKL